MYEEQESSPLLESNSLVLSAFKVKKRIYNTALFYREIVEQTFPRLFILDYVVILVRVEFHFSIFFILNSRSTETGIGWKMKDRLDFPLRREWRLDEGEKRRKISAFRFELRPFSIHPALSPRFFSLLERSLQRRNKRNRIRKLSFLPRSRSARFFLPN